jgi:hypothetical protein
MNFSACALHAPVHAVEIDVTQSQLARDTLGARAAQQGAGA